MTNKEHILFGRHSNIPECCIAFFIGDWAEQSKTQASYDRDPIMEYVRCPRCLREKRHFPLHKCTVRCEKFLKSINKWDSSLLKEWV